MLSRLSQWRRGTGGAGAGACGGAGAWGEGAREPVLVLAEAVGLLRSGAAPAAAWAAVGIDQVDHRGAPVVSRADSVSAGLLSADPVWDAVRAACALAHAAGSPLADVLEVVGEHAQIEREARAAREAAIAGPRLSATVLQWLPAMGLGLGALIDVHALRVLFLTALGWVLLTVAGTLMWAGRRWMESLVQGAEAASGGTSRPGRPGRPGIAGMPGSPSNPAGSLPVTSLPVTSLPVTLLLALMDAALASGLDVRSAVAAVGEAIGGADARALEHVASALALGEPWPRAWSDCPAPLLVLERALRSAWTTGTAPRALLRATATSVRLETRLAADKAVGELGVRMALPLTFCLLPAFALVGLVPMLVAVAASTSIEW